MCRSLRSALASLVWSCTLRLLLVICASKRIERGVKPNVEDRNKLPHTRVCDINDALLGEEADADRAIYALLDEVLLVSSISLRLQYPTLVL